MRFFRLHVLIRIGGLALLSLYASGVPAQQGGSQFLYCTTCHGAEGSGNIRIGAPRISGMEDWYVRNQFRAFLEGWRGEHVEDDGGAEMRAIARILQEPGDMEQVVDYVAAMNPVSSGASVSGDLENGRLLYQTCAACHGADGEGKQVLNAPGLSRQSDWYLVKSLNDFRSGVRGTHPDDVYGAQMKATITVLDTDTAVNDVVAYIKFLEG